jgi:hypothetical protein
MDHVPLGGIVAGGVLLFMAFARVYIRFEVPSHVTPDTFPALTRRFRVWESVSSLLALLLMVGFGFAWYYGLAWVGRVHLRHLGPSIYLLTPGDEMWMAAAVFLGIISAGLAMHWLYGRLLGDDYGEYTLYTNLKYRFDTWKAFRVIAIPMGLLCLAFIPLALDCYVRLTPKEIIVNRFLGFGERRYTYGQVRSLQLAELVGAPNGEIMRRPHIVVEFVDGYRLTTNDAILDERFERDLAALRYLAHESGKTIRRVQFDDGGRG